VTPVEYAQQVISTFSITSTPALSLNSIFDYYGILCFQQDFDDLNYCGSLHRKSDQTVIIVNTDIKNEGRINFTKSHEFGHFYMEHKGKSFTCKSCDLNVNHSLAKPLEVEANQFASAFLMPEAMIKPIVQTSPFNFDTIEYVRKHFTVSKLSAAFKILDFTFGDYALVSSCNGKIKHVKLSPNIAEKICLPSVDTFIPQRSFANQVLTTTKQMLNYIELPSDVWLSTQAISYRVFENSRADKKSNSCLTLLTFISK